MWVNWEFYKKMSIRDYEGWKRFSEYKRKQMSDREIMNAKRGITTPPQLKNIDQMPDQKWHRRISFLKSGIRIVGYVFIPFNLVAATALLVVSEVVGIVEELV